eukprot:CAMPEP_0206463912 /NCGR_PEP_ID=MMETSP0324_2-20121206/26896_1 /ASSEMBLY_ACC=CAM_ASM_000836 /TAXON_ID=2866 /ORGANISM="Crypthecodinium cohnii, Strain Seligo" /LENGTH=203 /DNA_ID=CAMNT_0053936429 /DNA_START=137 /DNA_END=748 /DNA_ORIENTATION=+
MPLLQHALTRYWSILQQQHSVLGVFTSARSEEEEAFNFSERALCLGMSVGCTWISVYSKARNSASSEEYGYYVDSMICAVGAGILNFGIGKSMVRYILKKDWDQSKGFKGQSSLIASAWASILSFGSLAHLVNFCITRPTEISSKLVEKWAHSVLMHILVVEPLNIALSATLAGCGRRIWKSILGLFTTPSEGQEDLERPLLK